MKCIVDVPSLSIYVRVVRPIMPNVAPTTWLRCIHRNSHHISVYILLHYVPAATPRSLILFSCPSESPPRCRRLRHPTILLLVLNVFLRSCTFRPMEIASGEHNRPSRPTLRPRRGSPSKNPQCRRRSVYRHTCRHADDTSCRYIRRLTGGRAAILVQQCSTGFGRSISARLYRIEGRSFF